MTVLFLVRHGENVANITKEFSHRLVDYDLTDKGRLQASQTADYFRSLSKNVSIDAMYSSPLKRAMQTADIVSEVWGKRLKGFPKKPQPVETLWSGDSLALLDSFERADCDAVVICGHNYDSGFGKIKELEEGDEVIFTDMITGNIYPIFFPI